VLRLYSGIFRTSCDRVGIQGSFEFARERLDLKREGLSMGLRTGCEVKQSCDLRNALYILSTPRPQPTLT